MYRRFVRNSNVGLARKSTCCWHLRRHQTRVVPSTPSEDPQNQAPSIDLPAFTWSKRQGEERRGTQRTHCAHIVCEDSDADGCSQIRRYAPAFVPPLARLLQFLLLRCRLRQTRRSSRANDSCSLRNNAWHCVQANPN